MIPKRTIIQLLKTTTKGSIHNYRQYVLVHYPIQRRSMSSSSVQNLLLELRQLDVSSLCDADKSDGDESVIKLMNYTIQPKNHLHSSSVMVGVARTVSFTEPNDFLPVMRALALEAKTDEVLVVDTLSSTRAVAGEIFVAEARRKGLAGIVIDGPIRDTAHLDDCSYLSSNNEGNGTTTTTMRIYATSVTPYSGTTDSPGKTQEVVTCGGIEVRPGDIVVGDDDGIIVGEASTFSKLIPIAKKIQQIESKLIAGITSSEEKSLASMTNLEDHVRHRLEGKLSNLEFRIQKIQK
ncbi:MAG: 4-hydroxy-4-methyl-2-oxoglutarate aldolase [Bacillariaceae sp.]|jgi:4-hydroxy-4-methyl-2-oxoglutarate aldolase